MIRSKAGVGLLAAIAFQLLVVVGMVVQAALPLWTGTEVRVRTVPVDPRSLFRGNYARLGYEFGTLHEDDVEGADDLPPGGAVFVSLEPGEDGLYSLAKASVDRPAGGVFLRGRSVPSAQWILLTFGIEAFFAPKEKALALEKDLRDGGIAVLMVDGGGRAALKDVIPDPPPEADADAEPNPDAGSRRE